MTFEVGVAEMPLRLRSSSYILSGGEIFSNTDLIDRVSAFHVDSDAPVCHRWSRSHPLTEQ